MEPVPVVTNHRYAGTYEGCTQIAVHTINNAFCETNPIPKTHPRSPHRAAAKKRNFQTNPPANNSRAGNLSAAPNSRATKALRVPSP